MLASAKYFNIWFFLVVAQHMYQEIMDSNTDRWFRHDLTPRLAALRVALAKYLGFANAEAAAEDLAILDNASTAVNSVLRAITFNATDKIFYFDIAYGMVKQTLYYVHDRYGAELVEVKTNQKMLSSTSLLLQVVRQALNDAVHVQKKPFTFASIDHISSVPAAILPVKELVSLFHEFQVKVLVDGAHAIGQIPLNVSDLGADFYLSNGHKWLYSPKGSAFLYVKKELQQLIHPTIISFGYKQGYQAEFAWTGTRDYSSYLAMVDAINWRSKVGGEQKIMNYMHKLSMQVAKSLSALWNTDVLLPEDKTPAMVCVRLPTTDDAKAAALVQKLQDQYDTFLVVYKYDDQWWTRLSTQIYNEEADFLKVGNWVLQMLKQ